MKKNWLHIFLAALLCATLLLIIPTALAYGAYCATCQQYREMDFDYYEELGFGSRRVHYPVYRCPVCKVAYRDYQQSAEHAGGTATCKELAVCSTCGMKYGNYGPHVGGKATCTVYAVCDVCHHIYGDRTAHTGGTATCLKPAKCTACYQEYGDLGPHTGGTATCTKRAICDVCQQEYGGLKPHTGGKATCTTHSVCDVCKQEYGFFASHQLQLVEAQPATCQTEGWTEYQYCTVCDFVSSHQRFPRTDHDLKQLPPKAPTCEETGWADYLACKNCDYYSLIIFEKLGHDPKSYDAKASTCTEVGWGAYEACQREGCSYSTRNIIPASGHSLTHHAAKAATCTEPGWEAYDTCSKCSYSTYQTLPALGHDLIHHEAQAAACTEIGWEAYDTCSHCDYTTYVELPALGHDYQAEIIPRTCEDDGYTLHTCTRCADRYADTIVPHCGHWYGEWTANGDGTQRAECLRGGCHHEKTVDCEIIELPVLNISLCPVCGTASDGSKLALANASVKIISGRIPHGEALLRVGTLANGEKLLTVGYVYGGQLSKASCQVKITLPAGLVNGYTLSLLNADGTETPLEYALEGDSAVLTLTFAQPTLAVRLTPAS